jgi:hypothetical protein
MIAQTTSYIHGSGKSYPSSGIATFNNEFVIDFGEMPTENLPQKPYGQTDYPFCTYNDNTTPQQKSITPIIGRNFGANNLDNGTPADNFLAISNNGNIFSVDNYAADIYLDTPDTIDQFINKWQTFFIYSGFSLYANGFFDPKCIYDKQNDRFINVILNKGLNYSNPKLLISFSDTIDLNIADWKHYEIKTDSLYPGMNYWFDYPNIAVNKDELFITLNVFDTNDVFKDNILFQINKQEGYNNDTLVWDYYKSIPRTSGQVSGSLFPLSDAMQDSSYNDGIYLVQTISIADGGADSLYWYHLTGNLSDTTKSINSYSLHTTPYTYYNYASQSTGQAGDRINVGRCRVRGGYYQNGKLHFVYMRSNSTWGQIVYSKINISTNTEQRATYGSGSPNNYCYPSIAHFGDTDTTEDAMICFLKVGLNDYPTIGVINYDGTWSNKTIVKQGDSLLNLTTYSGTLEDYEHWGDYTNIQRKYNSNPATCWLVGSYSFGVGPNLGNVNYGLNAWIAEIGDVGVGINELTKEDTHFSLYPNPTTNYINISFNKTIDKQKMDIKIYNHLGQLIQTKQITEDKTILLLSNLTQGVYYISITSKNKNYGIQKFIKY